MPLFEDVATLNGDQTIAGVKTFTSQIASPVVIGTPPAQPLVTAVIYQNTTAFWITVIQPVTGTVATTAQIALGPTNTPPVYAGAETILLASVKNIFFRVPSLWYYSITATGATFGTTQVISG